MAESAGAASLQRMATKDSYVRVRLDDGTRDEIEEQASEGKCSREARIRYLLRVALRLHRLVKQPAVLVALAEVPQSDAKTEQQIRQMLQSALAGN